MQVTQIYRAGLYCRFSQDDGQIGDSSSIITQKMMLENYCKEQNFQVVETYIDDGYSGTNFNRPTFQRLLNDIENNRINIVITKDLSRLGRDYIMTGYYTEIYFPSKNVRYIAINDNIDTIRDDNDIAPFKNILNDLYAKDISRKVKSAKKQRALQGLFLGSTAPYGYMKDPNNKNKLIIDEETSKVVRRIYDMMLSGYGTSKIVRTLTGDKVLIPSVYKSQCGITTFDRYVKDYKDNDKYSWNKSSIHTILKDKVYLGHTVNCKTQVTNYKTKKIISNSEDKWIVVQNTHEAIITQEEYDRVQELIGYRGVERRHNVNNLFKGLIRCSVCGQSMSLSVEKTRQGKPRIIYRCNSYGTLRCNEKHSNTIKYDDLKEIITNRIKEFFSLFKDDNNLIEVVKNKLNDNNLSIDYDKELDKIDTRLNSLTNLTKKIYDDYLNGVIGNGIYQGLVKKYQDEYKELEEKSKGLIIERDKNKNYFEDIKKLKDIVNSYLDFEELTQEMVFKLIGKIIVRSEGEYRRPKKRLLI